EEDEESETAKKITALTSICMTDEDSYDEGDVTYEELADSYKEPCLKSEEVCREIERQKKDQYSDTGRTAKAEKDHSSVTDRKV
ncbi:hypothetical protein A2U01_0076122, partial [Trifolium medium]|nr:hypothetical protein [Trifolium medium]